MRSPHLSPRSSAALDEASGYVDTGGSHAGTINPVERERQLTDLLCTERPRLVRFFRRQARFASPDEADDLAQEAITRFLRAAPSTHMATPQAYLRRIASNLLIDRAQHGSTRLAQISVPLVEGLDRPVEYDQHQQLEAREELAHYEQVLRQLKPRVLKVFLLSRVEGYTYKEIAARLGLTVFTVKRDMLQAIAHLDQSRRHR
ncbi:hypothetical protein GCM10011349_35710 [Novosphingobium indicum]|jgi:RNA polymerase sigma factor (sigma-70 family)|uniref:RNA polymerase subunit sigma-70 n=1 Tax=Novosphingobium indicum TaxID=462949 RepID=A0ABQ2JTX4_9SPHN|nr:RNA polymerase sigma factor [Novosphingobium indicum]GGN57294.1 hypothetical protein GCM10011349_35710 [Novosphingobium indicum]